jgi:hypothetical protein
MAGENNDEVLKEIDSKTGSKRAPSVLWTTAEDEKWLDLLLEEQALGMQAENGWKTATWVKVLSKLQEALPKAAKDKTVDKLKSWNERVRVPCFVPLVTLTIILLA